MMQAERWWYLSDPVKHLGTVTLEPIMEKEEDPYRGLDDSEGAFKPYYVAHSKLDTLALLADAVLGPGYFGMWGDEDTETRR